MAETSLLSEEEWALWWKHRGGRELRQILYWRWDPIGVSNGFPETFGEYDAYAGGLADLLRTGGNERAVVRYLAAIEDERLGEHFSSRQDLRAVSDLATSWFQRSIELWRELGS